MPPLTQRFFVWYNIHNISIKLIFKANMKQKRILISIVTIFIITVVCTGFFVPLGSYTTRYGCPIDPIPTQRLSLISGQMLENIKHDDKPQTNPVAGCAQNIKFIQYLF